MAVEVIGKIKPKNSGTFAIVDAQDIQVDGDGTRLDAALDGKVEKMTCDPAYAQQLYAADKASGGTILMSLGQTAFANRIVQFHRVTETEKDMTGWTGSVYVADPLNNGEATNKRYVHNNFSKKLYKHTLIFQNTGTNEGLEFAFSPAIDIISSEPSLGYNAIGTITGFQLFTFLMDYFSTNISPKGDGYYARVPSYDFDDGYYAYSFQADNSGNNIVYLIMQGSGQHIIRPEHTLNLYYTVRQLEDMKNIFNPIQ